MRGPTTGSSWRTGCAIWSPADTPAALLLPQCRGSRADRRGSATGRAMRAWRRSNAPRHRGASPALSGDSLGSACRLRLTCCIAPRCRRCAACWPSGQRFDAIDAHYVYPDGVAAVWLGGAGASRRHHGARHRYQPDSALCVPRALIRQASPARPALIAVSAALKSDSWRLARPRTR